MDFANYSQWSTMRVKGASKRLNQMLGFWVGPKRRDRRWEVTGVGKGERSKRTFWPRYHDRRRQCAGQWLSHLPRECSGVAAALGQREPQEEPAKGQRWGKENQEEDRRLLGGGVNGASQGRQLATLAGAGGGGREGPGEIDRSRQVHERGWYGDTWTGRNDCNLDTVAWTRQPFHCAEPGTSQWMASNLGTTRENRQISPFRDKSLLAQTETPVCPSIGSKGEKNVGRI